MEQELNLSKRVDGRSPADELSAGWSDESHAESMSWLRSMGQVDADVFVLHRCVDLAIEDAANWVGVSVVEAQEALVRCEQRLSALTA